MTETVATDASHLRRIPLRSIMVNAEKDSARGEQSKTDEFQELCESIAEHGLLQPISVIEERDAEGNVLPGIYRLADGLQRLTAHAALGMDYIDCKVLDKKAQDLLLTQVLANIQGVAFKPAQQAKSFLKLLARYPDWNTAKLASHLKKKESFVKDRLRLTKLPPEVCEKIDAGAISATNGHELTRLLMKPPLEDETWNHAVERAEILSTDEFKTFVKNLRNKIKTARKSGVEVGSDIRTPKLLKASEIHVDWLRIKKQIAQLEAAAVAKVKQKKNESDEDFAKRQDEAREGAVKPFTRGYFQGLAVCIQVDDETWAKRVAKMEEKKKKKEKKAGDAAGAKEAASLARAGMVTAN